MKLIKNDNEFKIFYKDREILCHSCLMPLLSVGYGKAYYKMNRGSFKINEKLQYKLALDLKNIVEENNSYIITMGDKKNNFILDLKVKTVEDNLIIEFDNIKGEINRLWINLKGDKHEHIYGCGETFTHLDLKGLNVRIWVAEHQNLKRIITKTLSRKILRRKPQHIMNFNSYETYYAQPTFVSSNKYFVHVDSNAYMEFDFTNSLYSNLFIKDIPKKIIIGINDVYEELLKNKSNILGRQNPLPNWVYNGAILGIQGGTEIMMNKVKNALKKGMKISGVWCQDWEGRRITAFGKQLMWNWEWDKVLYKDLDKAIIELNGMGIKFLGYINPFLALEGNLYKEASSKGYLIKDKNNNEYMVKITTFPAAMIDLTNNEAFEWIKNIIKKNMIDLKLSGWMADFGEYLPTDAVLYSGEDPEIVHNTWPALWAKANREAIEEAGKLDEILFFTRSGHTETIKYSTLMWSGDQHVDWSYDDGLASVIPSALSLSMSGFGLCHSDIGGYTTLFDLKRSRELFKRWTEICTFSPIMRNHEGNNPEVNSQFDDDEVILHYAKMSKVYNTISPYIKQAVLDNSKKGIPVMLPLFIYYDEERAYTEKYEYLLGKDILVAPVINEAKEKWEVYLPNDKWIHIWSQKEYLGGSYLIDAKLGFPPVFYRKNSSFKEIFEKVKYID